MYGLTFFNKKKWKNYEVFEKVSVKNTEFWRNFDKMKKPTNSDEDLTKKRFLTEYNCYCVRCYGLLKHLKNKDLRSLMMTNLKKILK